MSKTEARSDTGQLSRHFPCGQASSKRLRQIPGTILYDVSKKRTFILDKQLLSVSLDTYSSASENIYGTVSAVWEAKITRILHLGDEQQDESCSSHFILLLLGDGSSSRQCSQFDNGGCDRNQMNTKKWKHLHCFETTNGNLFAMSMEGHVPREICSGLEGQVQRKQNGYKYMSISKIDVWITNVVT